MSESSEGDWLALGEASRMLGVDPDTLRRWADEGRVPVFTTPGGHRRFRRQEIEAITRAPSPSRLDKLAHSTRRFVAACARAIRPNRQVPWDEAVTRGHRRSFRARGRAVAELLVAYVATSAAASRERLLERALALGRDYGEEAAVVGMSLNEAVEVFTFFRRPVIESLGEEVRRLGLSGAEASLAFADLEAALDRLLLAVIEGHRS